MAMDGRKYSPNNYRYGFNGNEKDDEVKGDGNSLDFGARIYDPRIGRWLSIDPLQLKFPSSSPYAGLNNNPIIYIDQDGKENIIYLVILPSSKTALTSADKQAIIESTTAKFQTALGITVKVVEFNEESYGGSFDGNNLYASDVAVAIGSVSEIKDFAKKNMANKEEYEETYEETYADYKGNADDNPERSENPTKKGSFGRVVSIDITDIDKTAKKFKVNKRDMISNLIVHGTGHNADLGHEGDDNVSNNPNVMTSGKRVRETLDDYIKPGNPNVEIPKTYNDYFKKNSANDYTSKGFKGAGHKFRSNTPIDNYKLNKSKRGKG